MQAALAAAADAPGFLRWLVAGDHHVEAIRYLAHALPSREGVWWACTCARRALGSQPPPQDVAALEAAEAHAVVAVGHSEGALVALATSASQRSGSHTHAAKRRTLRRAAMRAAEATDMQSAASLAAIACFFAGGSIAPAGAPPEPPPEHLCPTMVASAVLYACTRGPDERAPERYRLLLEMGLDIASGGTGRKG